MTTPMPAGPLDTPDSSGAASVSPPPVFEPPVRPGVLDFLAGFPALLAVFGTVAVLAASIASPPSAAEYAAESTRRKEKGDLPGAMVCLRRVIAIKPADLDRRYDMLMLNLNLRAAANADAKSGYLVKADALARAIVAADPSNWDSYGYRNAHLYVANRLMEDLNSVGRNANAVVPVIEEYLYNFVNYSTKAKQAADVKKGWTLLANLYSMVGPPEKARKYLEATAEDDPTRLYRLAEVCDKLGDHDQASRNYESAIKAARSRLLDRPGNPVLLRCWAYSALNLKDFKTAVDVLGEAFAATKDEEFHKRMAAVCVYWELYARQKPELASGADSKLAERLRIIEQGLKYDPTNNDLLGLLSVIMDEAKDSKEADEANKILNKMVASGQAAGISHFYLGTVAWRRKQFDVARIHWEAAFKLEPQMPNIANNLAFHLAHEAPTDPKRALSIVDQALGVQGNSPGLQAQLLGTRGEVLTKLERWREALNDLETALRGGQNSVEIHSALADTYEHLGMPDLAAEHKSLVESLKKPK